MNIFKFLCLLLLLPSLGANAQYIIGTQVPMTYTNTGGTGAVTVFDYSAGFPSLSSFSNRNSSLSGGVITIGCPTCTPYHNASGLWYGTQQPNGSWTSDFTFNMTGLSTPNYAVNGIVFAMQNSTAPPGASGFVGNQAAGDANVSGFGSYNLTGQYPLSNSVGIKFDANYVNQVVAPPGSSPNSTGLYTYGGPYGGLNPANDLNPYGINFYTNDLMAVHLVYDGTNVTETITDTVTNAAARYVWPINYSATIGASTSWVGFTVGQAPDTANGVTSIIPVPTLLHGWKFATGYNTRLMTPTLTPSPGAYTGPISISAPAGSTVYYTTNGLLPTTASSVYTGTPITLSANTNLQVVAVQSGYTDSNVGGGLYQVGTSNFVNLPSGFSTGDGIILSGYAVRSGSLIQLTDSVNPPFVEMGAAFNSSLLPTSSWTSVFDFKMSGAQSEGASFVIMAPTSHASNTPDWSAISQPTVIAGGGASLGYGGTIGTGQGSNGILNSVALALDVHDGNKIAVVTNGATPTGTIATSPVVMGGGDKIKATLTYSGSSLSVTLLDTVNSNSYSHTFTGVTMPASTAYFGFTAGTNGSNSTTQILDWAQ